MKTAFTLKPLLLALAMASLLAGCSGHEEAKPAAAAVKTVQARSHVIQPMEIESFSAAPGNVVALESVQAASRLMGYINRIHVVEGQAVKRGQPLFSIDPLDIDSAVDQARLGLKQAEDAMKDAKADHDRFESLYKDEVVSRQQYEKMKLNYEMAVTRMAQAKSGLGTAQGQIRYASVSAPIDGVVTRKLANEGDIAAPGHPVLMLENLSRLQVQTSVDEARFRELKLGQQVMVEIDGREQPVTARVARLSPSADPISHTYMVKLDVAAAGLTPGAFARVLFPAGKRMALAVPRAAVQERAGISGVFVVGADGLAQYRMLRLGGEVGGQVEALSGLNPGERVVTENAQAVNNGDKVSG